MPDSSTAMADPLPSAPERGLNRYMVRANVQSPSPQLHASKLATSDAFVSVDCAKKPPEKPA